MQAILLAGGLGTRLRSVVSDRPKPMALIEGRPFMEYVTRELVLMDDYNPFFFTVSNGAEPAFPVIVVKVPLIGPLRIYAADDIHQG